MKFALQYHTWSERDGGAWVAPSNIATFARTAEKAGFDGLSFTDHPAPTKKWLNGGGHETFDPFVGLAFFAAITSRIRLMTFSAVAGYRNPLLLAKSMTSLDVLSAGRATFVLGTGYMRAEFVALGSDFDERNALFDEALEVLRDIWSTDEYVRDGAHFTARGQVLRPSPVQRPHPPIWIGGNSKRARRRVAESAQGWAPMLNEPGLARSSRTAIIGSLGDLADAINHLEDELARCNRALTDIDVMISRPIFNPAIWSHAAPQTDKVPAPSIEFGEVSGAAQYLDSLSAMSEVGVTWTNIPLPHDSFEGMLDGMEWFGEEVIAKLQ